MNDLAMQVAQVDRVVVDDADPADAGGGEVERGGAAEAARTDDQRVRGAQLLLSFDPDLRQQDVPAIAEKLLVVQGVRGSYPRPPSSAWLAASACRSARRSATRSSPARP